jgi:hypothetical protein
MSYQLLQNHITIVVCDICGEFGAKGDRDWSKMRYDAHEEPIHLCYKCRASAVWCAAHQQYHLEDSQHRRPCADCGGLFTSYVRHNVEHCPTCQRNQPVPPQAPVRQPNFLASLRGLLPRWSEGVKAHRHI